MLLATVAIVFAVLILLSMPIVFALAVAGIAGLWIGGYPMQQLSSALVAGSQSWVLLAIPAFVFAGNLMERCGMSHALVELRARADRLGQGRARHVRDRRRLFLLRHLRIENGGGLRARLRADAAADQGRLRPARFRLADRRRHRDGHAGAAGDLHDRDRAGHQHLGGGAVRRGLHSGAGNHGVPDGRGVCPRPPERLAGRFQARA